MLKMSGKFKSNLTETNNLIYIMMYFSRGWGRGGISVPLRTPLSKIYPPKQSLYEFKCAYTVPKIN